MKLLLIKPSWILKMLTVHGSKFIAAGICQLDYVTSQELSVEGQHESIGKDTGERTVIQ